MRMTKPTKCHVCPAKTQISLGVCQVLSESSIFTGRSIGSLAYPLSAQRRLWSDWTGAQADLSFRWAHWSFCWFCHAQAHILKLYRYKKIAGKDIELNGPRQANLVLIVYASSEGSGEPAHPRSLARTFAARSYKQWVKRNLQTESQIPSPSEWLGKRS